MALSVKKVTWTLAIVAIASAATAFFEWNRTKQI